MFIRKIFESTLSEMPFPGLWGEILQNSDGQKTTFFFILFSFSQLGQGHHNSITYQRPWPMFLLYRLNLGAPIWPIEVGGPRVLPV